MSSYMEYEGLLVLISMGTGILLVLAYELLAAFRRAVPHHPMVSSGEDFVYWAFTGLFLFAVLYRYNQGRIRFFFLLGCFFVLFSIFGLLFSLFGINCKLIEHLI